MTSKSDKGGIWHQLALHVWNAKPFNLTTYLVLCAAFIFFGLIYRNDYTVWIIAKTILAVSLAGLVLFPLGKALEFFKNKIRSKITFLCLFCVAAILTGSALSVIRELIISQLDQTQIVEDPLNNFSGALFTLYSFLISAYFSESRKNVRHILIKTKQVEHQTETFKKFALDSLARETDELQSKAERELLPILARLDETLKTAGSSSMFVAQQIRDVIHNNIRPFARTIRSIRPKNSSVQPSGKSLKTETRLLPKKVDVSEIYNPALVILFPAPLYIIGFVETNPISLIWLPILEVALSFGLLSLFRQFMPQKLIPTYLAFLLLALIALATSLLVSIFSFSLNQTTENFALEFFRINGLGAIKFWLMASLILFEKRFQESSNKLDRDLTELDRATEKLSQRMWVIRRNWSYLIHGVVQTNLLAAQLMAEKSNFNETSRAQVRENLHRVLDALKRPTSPHIDLFEEFERLAKTWQGVVEIRYFIDEGTQEEILKNVDWRFALNEIVKEAVSNAAKHGEASRVDISLALDRWDLIFDISNNGVPPERDASDSLGKLMLNELTSTWLLTGGGEDELVHLQGRLVGKSLIFSP